jgi:RNA polymerase sigma-70 factor (ECF subfamily)
MQEEYIASPVRFPAAERLSLTVTTDQDQTRRFVQLLAEFERPMQRLCSAYASRATDRDDLFQEIFLAVWRALPGFRGDASVRTWVYRIAHNVALTWQARQRRRDAVESPLSPLNEDAGAGAEIDLRRLELKRAIARMPPGDRMLVLLWLEGLSAAEIEDVTGIRAATVAVRLSRIRRALQPNEVIA